MERISRRRIVAFGLSAVAAARAQQPGIEKANPRLYTFVGGKAGAWSVASMNAVTGEPMPRAERLEVINGPVPVVAAGSTWALRGVTSNTRYTTRSEREALAAKQANVGRATATRAALIPIRKNAAWWDLTQDERRRVFEESSHHTKAGLKYLSPAACTIAAT